jgi:hypothetical protein
MAPFVMLSFLLLAVTPAFTAALEPIRLPGVDLQRLQDLRKQRQSQNLDFTSDVLAPAITSDVPSTQYLDVSPISLIFILHLIPSSDSH